MNFYKWKDLYCDKWSFITVLHKLITFVDSICFNPSEHIHVLDIQMQACCSIVYCSSWNYYGLSSRHELGTRLWQLLWPERRKTWGRYLPRDGIKEQQFEELTDKLTSHSAKILHSILSHGINRIFTGPYSRIHLMVNKLK